MSHLAGHTNYEDGHWLVGSGACIRSSDALTLVSSLLVFVAKGDGTISSMETQRMIDLLSSRLRISSAEALESLSAAVMSMADDEDFLQTLRTISEELSTEDKRRVFTMMLEVAAADGKQDPREIEAVNAASRILGMRKEEVHRAFKTYFADHQHTR
ncbi:MAG: TerB family tellurite resistance protein [Halioglobus sp.]